MKPMTAAERIQAMARLDELAAEIRELAREIAALRPSSPVSASPRPLAVA
jgi:hypothetical protein